MVHVVCSSRNQSGEDLSVTQVANVLDIACVEEIRQVVDHIGSVNVRVVEVLSVGHLESVGQVFEQLLVELWDCGFPIELLVAVDQVKSEQITIQCTVDIKCIIVIEEIVLVVVLKVSIIDFDGFIGGQLFGNFGHFLDDHGLGSFFVSLA